MKHVALLKFALLAVGGAFLLAMASPAPRDISAAVGSPAPDFTLEDQDGNAVSLSDFAGKVVVLEWFNFDCPFVQRHYKAGTMVELANRFKDKGVVWLNINSTHYAAKADNKKFRQEHHLAYTILSDASGKVGKMYGAKTTPHMYIIDKKGTLVYAGGIDDDPNGQSARPTNYVAKALEEILAGKAVSVPESKPYGCSVKYAKN